MINTYSEVNTMEGRILTADIIDDFRKNLELQEKSTATIEKYIRDVKAFSVYAQDEVITNELVIAYKNHTAFYSLLCCIAEQFLFQFLHDKNRARFSLAIYNCLAALYRLDRDVLQLADTNTCGTNRLNN